MSRKFRVNASRKPVKCKMSDEEFYTRDFPSVAAGKVVVKPQRGNWTVFIGLSDGTIAYQWCESKEKAQREAKYARDTIKRYGADDSYWAAEGYKIWNPNVKSSTRPTKRKSTVKAASSAAEKDLYDDLYSYADQYRMTSRWTKENVTKYLERQKSFRRMTDSDFQRVVDRVNRDFKRNKKVKSDPYSDMSYKSGVESSRSTKRKFTIKADALSDFRKDWTERIFDKNYPSEKIEVHFKDGRAAQYTAAVLDRMMSDPDIDYIIDAKTGELLYESEHGDVRGSKSVKCSTRPTKRKSTVKAARNPKIEDWGDGPVKVFWKSGKWSIIMDGYGLGITDGWGVERPIIYTHKNPPTVAYDETAVSVPPYVKRKFEELVQKGVLKNRSDLYDSGEWDTYFEASTSTKRRRSVKCSALDNARDNREELSGTYYIVYNGNIIVETDGTGDAGEDALAEVFTMDADALAAAVEYLNSFGDDLIEEGEVSDAGEVARVLSQFIQMEYDEGQMDPTYFGSEIYWDGGRIEWFDAADLAESNNVDEWVENTDLSAEDLDIDSAQSIECGDAIADRFMVDLMYQKNGGYAEDCYFDDWSEVEAYAHDGLMRGLYARIWDKQTGDTITISPDEYAEAWENGAADFDINEDIVNFKNRVVTSSTKIEAFRDDTVDETAVRELVLVITNDGDLYRQRTTPIIENLKKKAAKGTYDREKAVKLWQYLADDGVRMYDKEYGSGRGSVAMLNPATRRRIAEELRDYYEEEIMWDINHTDDDSELTTM